ncbi:MAG: hypothetical protein ACRDL5_11725, partial [Solirubrobacteraceae bacterium]
ASAGARGTFNRTKLVACLKSHGVTLPNRPPGAGAGPGAGTPGASGSGAPGTAGSQSGAARRHGGFFGGGGAFANPKLRAALQACGAARFSGGAGGRRFTLNHTAVLKFVACVRKHGYKLPTPNFSGHGSIFSPSIERNSKFQAASRACSSLLRPPGGAAAPGTGTGPPAGSTTSTSGA